MRTVAHLSAAETAGLDDFLREARRLLGPELLEARLFGSRARGSGGEDSDLDIALIVTPRGRTRRREIYDHAYDAGLRHGVQIAPLVIDGARLQELRSRERLIAADLDREGIPL